MGGEVGRGRERQNMQGEGGTVTQWRQGMDGLAQGRNGFGNNSGSQILAFSGLFSLDPHGPMLEVLAQISIEPYALWRLVFR